MKQLENRFINIDETDIHNVSQSMREEALSGTAPVVARYEEALMKYFRVNNALAVSSGTSALHLLLILFDIGEGDEVILPPSAPIMSVLPVLAVRATPVFVDVQQDNFGIDPTDLNAKITTRTKAVISVPMWGYPTPEDQVINDLKRRNITLIQDASHCHGATQGDEFVGTRADVSFFSTQERKLVATGEGGFILTESNDIADRVRELRDFGKPIRQTPGGREPTYQYGHLFGLNFRLSAMSAALGITQLEKLNAKIERRKSNADEIKKCLKQGSSTNEMLIPADSTPNYYALLLHVRGTSYMDANRLGRALLDRNIVSDTHRFNIKPLYEYPLLQRYRSVCRNAERLMNSVVTIPTHEGLNRDDMDRIISTLEELMTKEG
jgi:dTDP-4-amino-4,6-dideoxygalactose transaminase